MAMKIVILEDNLDRQAVMRRCLADRFYKFDGHFFDDAWEMIRFLEDHLAETLVISLDNDLELKPGPDGSSVDPGEGRQVAEFLAGSAQVCPVIIHTTNSHAAEDMKNVLHAANWKTKRIVPFDDMNWIESDWFFAIRRSIVGPTKHKQSGSRS
ncbi:MAG: hypothetical protein L0241_17550 [Planctomycetia bacterium]|nr:hypothetical protein [Planctomycetia bacterium]